MSVLYSVVWNHVKYANKEGFTETVTYKQASFVLNKHSGLCILMQFRTCYVLLKLLLAN